VVWRMWSSQLHIFGSEAGRGNKPHDMLYRLNVSDDRDTLNESNCRDTYTFGPVDAIQNRGNFHCPRIFSMISIATRLVRIWHGGFK
jgi:hypothetical protein